MTISLPDTRTLSSFEYEEPCLCGELATWVAWVSHSGTSHRSIENFLCEECKVGLEGLWVMRLRHPAMCSCGQFYYGGQLSDHFRAIPL